MGTDQKTLVDMAVHHGWPYSPQYWQVPFPPFATTQIPLVMHMYRDPTLPGYTIGLDHLPDNVREKACCD